MRFLVPAIVCLLGSVLAIPLVLVAVLRADPQGRLPWWAWWLETHDALGWSGPVSEGYPATRWGLVRWLWRNRAYALRDYYRAELADEVSVLGHVEPAREGLSWWLGRVGPAWEVEVSLGLRWFRVYLRAGWKLRPWIEGHRPAGPSATGMLIPIGIRIDDFDE